MATLRDLLLFTIGLAALVAATVGSRTVVSETLSLAIIVGGVLVAFGVPLVAFGPEVLWWGEKDERSRAIYYRASAVAWYATMGALFAGSLSVEYLPSAVSLADVLWGLLVVALVANVAGRAYFARTM